MLTLSGVSQLSTHHSGISNSPEVITHSAPHTVHADLHSAFVCNVSSCQSQLTSYTWGCIIEQKYIETKLSSYCYFPILDQVVSVSPLQNTFTANTSISRVEAVVGEDWSARTF